MVKTALKTSTAPAPAAKGALAPAPKGKEAPAAKAKANVKTVVVIKASALSIDVGPAVLAGMAKSYETEAKANQLMAEVESKRYDLLSQTTAAIVKAAKADTTIDLTAAFSGDAKRMNVLNDQIGLALGFREVTTLPATDKVEEIKRIGYAKSVLKYFPGPKDDKNSPEAKRKSTLRSNFLHMVKKCAMAASGIIATGSDIVADKASGTLQISGPAVEKQFGAKSVLLNEKQTVGTGETAVKLTAKPSFTAIANMGAEAAGKVLAKRKQSGIASNATDPAVALQSIAKSLAEACSKIALPASEETKRALAIAQSAIEKVLGAKAATA